MLAQVKLTPGSVGPRYRFKGCLFYGGSELCQSYRLVHEFITAELFQQRVDKRPFERTVHLDVHTGLNPPFSPRGGPFGWDTLLINSLSEVHDTAMMCGAPPPPCAMVDGQPAAGFADSFAGYRKTLQREHHLEVPSGSSFKSEAGGTSYRLNGALTQSLLPTVHHICGIDLGACVRVTQEFATDPYPMMVSNLVAAALLRGELALLRQARNAGVQEAPPLAHLLRQRVADYFYPQDAHWKNLVTTRGLLLLDRALAWVSQPA